MNIIVCVKQIPDVAEMKFDSERKTLIREGVKNVLNPFDRRAIAEAVRIKSIGGGEVTAITMGPPQAREALLECLVVGADRCLHLLDQAFAGADTLATARALALCIKQRAFDLIVCGKHSVDAETGHVGPELAEMLGIPHVAGVCSISFDCQPGYFVAERETDEGFETVECKLPALITAAERLVRPVKVKEPDIEAVRHRDVEIITAADLSTDTAIFGLAGSPTRVSEIRYLEKSREVEMIAGDARQMAESLVERLCAQGLFSGWKELELKAFAKPRPLADLENNGAPAEMRDILTLAEVTGGRLRGVSFELLGKGRELARRTGGEVAAILIGDNVAAHAGELASYGADRVYLIEGERFASYNPMQFAGALTETIERLRPHSVLIPSTATGRDYAPRVAARLGLGLTADCVDLELNERSELIQYKPAFGGQIVAPIFSNTWPQMASVRPGMLAMPERDPSRSCTVETIALSASDDDRYRVLEHSESAGSVSADLDDPEIVVCVGMGIGGPENLAIIESLAAEIGAVIGATRRAVDRGWLPRQQQIGITGRSVAPKLYIGVGVRGAFNHTIGIQRAGIVAAINNDPEADIFKVADYGMAADFAETVPALIEALARKKLQLAEASLDR